MAFTYEELVAQAGVDPRALRDKLKAGDPAQIEELASAFYKAGSDMSDAASAHRQSVAYKNAGYTVDGQTPLDYNGEVAHAKALSGAAEHLPQIAKILTGVGSHLEESTKSANAEVSALDTQLARINSDYVTATQGETGSERADERTYYLGLAVQAVKTHGGTVHTLVTDYETTLGGALKSMADLGYIPSDPVDEGPGDVNLDNPEGDAQTTIDATRNPDKKAGLAQYDRGTLKLSLINAAIKANGGRVDDTQYDYLTLYYNNVASHSGDIYTLLKDTPGGDIAHRAAVFADGMLNLSRAAEQPDDAGHGPHAEGPGHQPIGRGGYEGLPSSVQDILSSDLGNVVETKAYPEGTGTMMRRAEWKDGHWVIANYDTDSGFAGLLGYAHKGVVGGDGFSQNLADAGIRWKQDLNTVDRNTSNWMASADAYHHSYVGKGWNDVAAENGMPSDTNPDHLKLPDDTMASNALDVAARNQDASAHVLLDANERRSLLGLNWENGTGAADLLLSGTAPDPHRPDSIRNEAALAVMKDTGADYANFAATAAPDMKNAVTLMGIRHMDTFAQNVGPDERSTIGQLDIPGGTENGVVLSSADQANFLKMIATLGPDNYALFHAEGLTRGAEYLAVAQHSGHDLGLASAEAARLDGRITAAGNAAVIESASHQAHDEQAEYAAELKAQQDEKTNDLLVKGTLQGLNLAIGLGGLAAPEAAAPAFEALGLLNEAISSVHEDAGALGADPNSPYIQALQQQMQTALDAPKGQAQVHVDTQTGQEWMAARAWAINHPGQANPLIDARTDMPVMSSGGLVDQSGHAVASPMPSDPDLNRQIQVAESPAVRDHQLKQIMDNAYVFTSADPSPGGSGADQVYGSPSYQGNSWGDPSRESNGDAGSLYDDSGSWGSGASAYQIRYGDDQTYDWNAPIEVAVGDPFPLPPDPRPVPASHSPH